jgi:hypothetical protein
VFLANIDPEVQASVLDQIKRSAVVGCDTMNFWIEKKRPALERILKRVDMLVINESEVREIAGEPNILRAGSKILQMGPKHLVVKRGEYGVLILSPGSFFALPAFPVEDVQDPTGAGDTFAACGKEKNRRAGAAPGGGHGQRHGLVLRRGVRPRRPPESFERRHCRALPRLQAPHALRGGVIFRIPASRHPKEFVEFLKIRLATGFRRKQPDSENPQFERMLHKIIYVAGTPPIPIHKSRL